MGVYAEFGDVKGRYEGTMSDERQTWVELRIDDVESELFYLVPDLEDDVTENEPARARRVCRLICDKVLDLYRNPNGASGVSNIIGPRTDSLTGLRGSGDSWVQFSDDELARVGYVDSAPSVGSVTLRAYGQ